MKHLLLTFVLALLPALAHAAWWNADWTLRKAITLDARAAQLPAEVQALPLLVRLSSGNFDFLSAREDGGDLRFVAADGATVLPHRVERFDPINELAFVWVQVPRVAPGEAPTRLWLYYGNAQATAPAAAALHDAAQWAVYPLSDAAGLPQDVSGAGHHVRAGNLAYVPDGLIAGGARLAADGGLSAGGPALLAAPGLTVSAWIRPERADGELLAAGALTLSLRAGVPVLALGAQTAQGQALATGSWHHMAVVADAGGAALLVGGREVARVAGAYAPVEALRIGAGLAGLIDEVQISTVARPAAWLLAQADTQGMVSRLLTLGPDEPVQAARPPGYIAITLQALTLEGWVVIALCGVLLLLAAWVAVTKAMLVSLQATNNREFEEAFDEMADALHTLRNGEVAQTGRLDALAARNGDFEHSSLHRLFRTGVLELKARAAARSTAGEDITQRGLDAVRAILDTQLVRERQRLDSGMVMLTLAISGGPFLGLLGTVIGVMITFAAVAVAGDISIEAIAPGVSAALLTTVAGLMVAIPALFAYNYLQTRIKALTADMTVFSDEFVSRLAESYSR
jgi:biopolymer transport protein ExbB